MFQPLAGPLRRDFFWLQRIDLIISHQYLADVLNRIVMLNSDEDKATPFVNKLNNIKCGR